MNLTQRALAEKVGLSYPTVNRALNGLPGMSEETRRRVLETAKRLGYRKNAVARSLVLQRTNSIGLVISNNPHSFWASVVEGIESRARKQGYHVILCHSEPGGTQERENEAISFLVDRQIEGLILAPGWRRKDFAIFKELEQRRLPVLLLDSRLAGVNASFAGADDVGGGRLGCRHLIGLGHRRIAFVAGPSQSATATRRLEGYRLAMKEAGLPVEPRWILRAEGFLSEHGQQAAEAVLAIHPRPTAVFAVNDPVAFGLEHALLRAGVRMPKDLALVGFSGMPEGELLAVPLTTVAAPMQQMGRRAAEIVIALASGKQAEPVFEELPCQLIVRASCGAVAGSSRGLVKK